jgi:glycosyltransferase involved in cell wall biosynthesis
LSRRKGIGELIAAFGRIAVLVPDAHLFIVGEGAEGDRFRAMASRMRCRDRIHFEGFRPFPEDYMRAADIFVLASRREAFGLVIPEARSAGAAILATAVDGVPEALDGGAAGILVPPRDSDALSNRMYRLLTNADELRLWRKRASQNLDQYHVNRMCRETIAVYEELLEPPR